MKTSLKLVLLLASSAASAQVVPWSGETVRIPSFQAGDPTVMSYPDGMGGKVELIIGTDQSMQGVYSYRADGAQHQLSPVGLVNAADARGSVLFVTKGGAEVLVYVGETDGGLFLDARSPPSISTPKGIAVRRVGNDFEVWVNTVGPTIEHYRYVRSQGFSSLGSSSVSEQPSGMAVDDATGRVFVAQPSSGVIALEPDGGSGYVISIDAGELGPLVGGLDVVPGASGGVLIFTTSPQTDEVVVHRTVGASAVWLGAFKVGDWDGGTGRVRSPLHLDAFSGAFAGYPQGILVVHDSMVANYKLLSLVDVDAVVPLGALVGSDGGLLLPDGGTPRPDGGQGIGPPPSTGRPGSFSGVDEPPAKPCGCTSGPIVLPALMLLWWIRRRSRS